ALNIGVLELPTDVDNLSTDLQGASCAVSFQQRTYKSLHALCQFNNVLTRCFMYFVISTTYLQVASCTLLFQQRTYKSLHVLCQFNNVLTSRFMYFVNLTTYLQGASCTLSFQQRTYKSLHVLCYFNNVLTCRFMYFVNSTTYLPYYLLRTIHNFFYYFSCRLLLYNGTQVLSCPE